MDNAKKEIRNGLQKEEIFNSITHAIGLVLATIGVVVLVVNAHTSGLIAVIIYGVTLVLLYLASTLYHITTHEKIKAAFRVFDHVGIFLLIAGTYTPFCLIALKGQFGAVLLSMVWLLALAGLILKIFFTGKYDLLSTLVYLALGWLVIFVVKPVYEALPVASFVLLIAGGVSYSSGVLFYRMPRLRYHHGIWHIFVLGGSALHFVAVWLIS